VQPVRGEGVPPQDGGSDRVPTEDAGARDRAALLPAGLAGGAVGHLAAQGRPEPRPQAVRVRAGGGGGAVNAPRHRAPAGLHLRVRRHEGGLLGAHRPHDSGEAHPTGPGDLPGGIQPDGVHLGPGGARRRRPQSHRGRHSPRAPLDLGAKNKNVCVHPPEDHTPL